VVLGHVFLPDDLETNTHIEAQGRLLRRGLGNDIFVTVFRIVTHGVSHIFRNGDAAAGVW